ncbi:NAD-dependent epimerase/dehydratase family protein [Telluria beijingensis]|uniref:NAD-dependent epimerase/dehydratase family protein n=1 Tax=Telluria beijingensis TaxID=3068633 RepID=UPI002795B8B6|nr:NAD-dependent epimerase/dehydratase family protein [Massilia sp. REN29]
MHVLVTGAAGFVGSALVELLLADTAITSLRLVDLAFDDARPDPRVERIAGSIGDPAVMARAVRGRIDLVYHLASVPGGLAERDYELGRDINLYATLALVEAMRAMPAPPVFVFASSIAALGAPLPPGGVDDATPMSPQLSYGAHKLAGELFVADATRRGWIDGRSVRLPAVVARPAGPSGLVSAFLSDMIRALAAGEHYRCPIRAGATSWLVSTPCAAASLVHAATLDGQLLGAGRACTLPALRLSMAELVAAVGQEYGVDAAALASHGDDPAIEANFGSYPPLRTPRADAAGFVHDGDARALVRNALR